MMEIRQYLNFDIHIGSPNEQGQYPLRVIHSPAGQTDKALWAALPTTADFHDRLAYLRDLIATPDEAVAFGRALHHFLFPPPIRDLYQRSRGMLPNDYALRLRLCLETDLPDVAQLPWEYCHNGQGFLALDERVSLVRYLFAQQPTERLALPTPVRLLLVSANPAGDLRVTEEAQAIAAALQPLIAGGSLAWRRLDGATRPALREAVQTWQPHALHVTGHGQLADGEGTLLLCQADDGADAVDAHSLMALLQGTSVQLALFNACHSADYGAGDPLLGLVQRLAWAGMPAAIGMQFAVPQQTAQPFSQVLYARLAAGLPLDQAVTQARQALYFDADDKLFWAIPALYLRAPDTWGWADRVGRTYHVYEAPPQPGSFAWNWRAALGHLLFLFTFLPGRAANDHPPLAAGSSWEGLLGEAPAQAIARLQVQGALRSAPDADGKLHCTLYGERLLQAWLRAAQTGAALRLLGDAGTAALKWVLAALGAYHLLQDVIADVLGQVDAEAARAWKQAQPSQGQGRGGSARITLGLQIEWVHIPAGYFWMGSEAGDPDARDDEKPRHRLYLPGYYIAKYPITNRQYAVFARATGHRLPSHWEDGRIPPNQDDHPVRNVSWSDAVAFCAWAARQSGHPLRLPTEAEWEKAARGPNGYRYPWGDRWDGRRCNTAESKINGATPVTAYPGGVSPYGVWDMVGNVWEWTSSAYKPYPYQADDGRERMSRDESHVIRGGAYYSDSRRARAASRARPRRLARRRGFVWGGRLLSLSPLISDPSGLCCSDPAAQPLCPLLQRDL